MTEQDLTTRVAVLEAVVREKEASLKLQAQEYERRLSDLNHEHSRSREVLGTYVPRETYYSEKSSTDGRISALEKSQWLLGGAIGLAVFVIPIVLHFWK